MNLWGDWLSKLTAELNTVQLTAEERYILKRAAAIRKSYTDRLHAVALKFTMPT